MWSEGVAVNDGVVAVIGGDVRQGAHDGGWREVHRQLRSIARRRAALDAEEARWLRRAEQLEIWTELGYATILEYMERVLGHGPHAALDRLRVARKLGELRELGLALRDGSLSYSAIRELTRVVTPATEAAWIDATGDLNLREIEALVSGHRPGDLPDEPASPDVRSRMLQMELPPETYAMLRQTQAALEREIGHRLDDAALIHLLCERAVTSPGAASAEPTGAKHQIAITVCGRCQRGWQDGAGATIELGAAAIELARCDAQHIGALDENHPTRASHDITPSVRRLVWRRDHGRCQVPGCRSSRHLHVHHITARAHGGTHEPTNLTLLCSAHHRLLHAGAIAIAGTAPDLTITNLRSPAAQPAAVRGTSEK